MTRVRVVFSLAVQCIATSLISTGAAAGVTAEQILGQYWKDPLFGAAAAEKTVVVEVLNRRMWPERITVDPDTTIRFVFENKSEEPHLLAFSADIEALLNDESFRKFREDEIFHASKKQQPSGHHHHEGGSVDDAAALVKLISQRPTVFVSGYDRKEILIKFNPDDKVRIFCALDSHHETGYVSQVVVRDKKPNEEREKRGQD